MVNSTSCLDKQLIYKYNGQYNTNENKRQLQHMDFNISEIEINISRMYGVKRCCSKQLLSWENQNKVDELN